MSGRIRLDLRTGYDLEPGSSDDDLTRVGRGTPMGELLRRYWHPVGLVEDATDTPRAVRVLGEDLVLFRDGQGRPGLVVSRCCHRGTTLYYGRVDDYGIRCCYHGWLFDVEGNCLEQPCEPEGGRHRDRVRQPWYPVQERYGLIFAYMGPPDRKPTLPRYDCLERLADGEFVEADNTSIGSGGPAVVDCNWFQHFENVVDPHHVVVLHGWFSKPQFPPGILQPMKRTFGYSARGVVSRSARLLDDGRAFYRITEAALPTLRLVGNPFSEVPDRLESIGWTLPIDDTHYRIYVAGRVSEPGGVQKMFRGGGVSRWASLTPEQRRAYPGDYEAQVGQGPITLHSHENLASTDRGVVMLRRLFRRQIDAIGRGEDPIGVHRGDADPLVELDAGTYIIDRDDSRLAGLLDDTPTATHSDVDADV